MSATTLDLDQIVRMVAPLRPEVDDVHVRSVFARAVWSSLTEPGDPVAQRVIDALGPTVALDQIILGTEPSEYPWREGEPAVTEDELQVAIARWKPRVSLPSAVRMMDMAARNGLQILLPTDPMWPAGFADLGERAPIMLWWKGAQLDLSCSIAVVGARAATGYGEHAAHTLVDDLSHRGHVIVSGGAYGIDGTAHSTAVSVGGKTVAFLAGGPDRAYPAGHHDLFQKILEAGGALVSELPPGAPPTRWRFLLRNRLIAAATQATVVVEAGYRSGSLHTANAARELGRPVGAVPGPITSAASAGCHRLIRDGATLVTSADEVIFMLGEEVSPGA